jgi:DNA-binding CsgD family transcriptional regulator
MDRNDRENAANVLLIQALFFVAIVVGGIIDLTLDRPTSWRSAHVLFEVCMVLLSLGAALWLGRGWYQALGSVSRLERLLVERQAERDAWQGSAERLLEGLAHAIDAQFRTWGLTNAERETALMLLKGYSHKRIAKLTDRSERTVRQHAVAVYRKSGLAGRAELAAYFLEGLPVPRAGDDAGTEIPADVS